MKKLRVILTLVLTLGLSIGSYAQGKYGKDSAECIKFLSFYRDYLKQNNIEEASPLWRQAYKLCPPQSSQNMLIDGQKIMKYWIDREKDAAVKKAMIDTLMNLHDLRSEYYPKYALNSYTNKALDMVKYADSEDDAAILESLEKAVSICKGKSFPSAGILVIYMNKAAEMYKEGKIQPEDVMNAYQLAVETGESVMAKKPSEVLKNVLADLEQVFATSGVASCENLVTLFTPKFEADSTNKDLVSGIVKLLSDTQCTNENLFLRSVNALHKLDPSHSTAFYLYKLNSSRGNTELAAQFLLDAINQEGSDDLKDGEYYLELATYYYKFMSSNAKAVDAAKQAANLNPSLAGKAYLLIGTIWGNMKCEGNDIEQRAKFWVAVDYLAKAKAADATLAEEANRLISSYSQYFPLKADAFMYDVIDGASYTVSCNGLRETTKVRTQSN